MVRRRTVAAAVVLVLVLALFVVGWSVNRQRQWFALQRQQLQTVLRLEQQRPSGWSAAAWENAVVTTHNVWGNVTYAPEYSGLSLTEMQRLQQRLEEIVANTTAENSRDSLDQVFELLLSLPRARREFITGYRDEIRSWQPSPQ